MNLKSLTAISPIDGRYRGQLSELSNYFSEHALIYYRVFVEIEYFIALIEIPLPQLSNFPKESIPDLRKIYSDYEITDSQRVKDIEKTTNHDVKAVEYFIKEKLSVLGLSQWKEFVHFGLTSQDINNTSVPLSLKDAVVKSYMPLVQQLVGKLDELVEEYKGIPMLARTHGQAASPTRLGKEIQVFSERMKMQISLLQAIPYSAKFGGATGNFNAHYVAYKQIDWISFANKFVNQTLGLHRSHPTTQIEHYDNLAAMFDNLKRINTILIDLDRDMWTYISMDYFKQKIQKNEVGSSTMPHKVNPIDFENSEGNFGIANAMFEHLSAKLPISRMQRDLTDSTVLRNIGVPVAHTILAMKSLLKGLNKIILNEKTIQSDLDSNWPVVSEAIQTILRRENYPNPYESLKELTRIHGKITKNNLSSFIDNLDLSQEIKAELKEITPFNYTGI